MLFLSNVSDPDHTRYGQHLSFEEVNDLVKPADKTLDSVHEWLSDNGISIHEYSPAKDWINVYIDVESAERLLDTKYSVFKHEDGSQLVRTSEWSLPTHLHEMIDTIQPTTSFLLCQFFPVTIECFRILYGTIDYTPKAPGINKIAFNNYLNESPIRPDINSFLKKYRPETAPTAFTFKSVEIANGPAASYDNLNAEELAAGIGKEANLDAQTILGMVFPTSMYSYSTGGSPPFIPDINTPEDTNEPNLVWVNYVLGKNNLPQVISSSYGDDEQIVPKSYADRVCKSFATLGARGISLLVSSGDDGLGGEDGSTCISNDSKNSTMFLPAFPAGYGKQHSFYASGSGFSNYYSRPKYQDGVVDKYVKSLGGKYKGLYNQGTSASCPLSASIISLINDDLISGGKPTLGFLNLWLYKKGYKGFTDVAGGNTSSCGTDGFPVTKGWDPITSFGTPNFPELIKLAN
ncbi:putative Tripeptidyl-peptidase SED2 [Leptodontidium sp. 2 PMI_412]|nr:putative Tripeptidyl-peptidase SED2 [Leptodontidium sp. 2 PMI_412]